ncbi:alpha/beta hydrolase fold domain-containing protein [Streptomyces sp. NRRL B-1677]|uniref:alpha/beta hydrolase fold domain-containing protein n=1 Tax=Streptomyces sp. NRRL B-1677 TaxID=2682966 RepID=UPI00189293ED
MTRLRVTLSRGGWSLGRGRRPRACVRRWCFSRGGWIVGDLDTHDNVCRRLCRDLEAVVVSVGYRLAPEHPFPAGYDDCLAVARHVAAHRARFGGGPLALAGDSASADFAAAVALALRDDGTPVAAQLLACPATDLQWPHRVSLDGGERHRAPADRSRVRERHPAVHRRRPRRAHPRFPQLRHPRPRSRRRRHPDVQRLPRARPRRSNAGAMS